MITKHSLYSCVYFICLHYRQHANSVGTLSGHGSWILSVDFCPDNTHFVSRCVLDRLYWEMPKICLMKLVYNFETYLEFCKNLLWNMEWEMFLISTCIINSKRVICLLSLEIKPWSQEIEYKKNPDLNI